MLSWFQRSLGTTGDSGLDAANFLMLILAIGSTALYIYIFAIKDGGFFALTTALAFAMMSGWIVMLHKALVRYYRCKRYADDLERYLQQVLLRE